MNYAWEPTAFGDVLTRSELSIAIDPTQIYEQITVRMWGNGVVSRGTVLGSELGSSKWYVAHSSQFILSKIDARNGAFGLVPSSLDGAIVSNDFPLFDIDSSRLLPEYLYWLSRTHGFVEVCKQASEGTTNRVRLKIGRFLAMQIPLPPLEEQRRIVAYIDALAARIAEARGLRQGALEEAEGVFGSTLNILWQSEETWNKSSLGNLAKTVSGQVDPRLEPYASLPHINGEAIESGTCRLLSYRLAKEDEVISGKYHFPENTVLYSKIRPYLRKATLVRFEGVCSADIYAFDEISPELDPSFFMYSLISPRFTIYANMLSGRTRMPKLNQSQIFAFELSYPSRDEQCRIVTYLDDLQARVDKLKRLQSESAAELDALLPSVLDKAFRGELL